MKTSFKSLIIFSIGILLFFQLYATQISNDDLIPLAFAHPDPDSPKEIDDKITFSGFPLVKNKFVKGVVWPRATCTSPSRALPAAIAAKARWLDESTIPWRMIRPMPLHVRRARGRRQAPSRCQESSEPCFWPRRPFSRPITFEWIWQTRLSVSASISPISRIVWPYW